MVASYERHNHYKVWLMCPEWWLNIARAESALRTLTENLRNQGIANRAGTRSILIWLDPSSPFFSALMSGSGGCPAAIAVNC